MCAGTWTHQPGDTPIDGSLMISLELPFSLLSCSTWLLPHFALVGSRLDPLRRPHLHCAKPPHPCFPTSITFLASLTLCWLCQFLGFFLGGQPHSSDIIASG